jgi:acyl-CoA synthetase (AMP-forming)/AMP-acid ligase II
MLRRKSFCGAGGRSLRCSILAADLDASVSRWQVLSIRRRGENVSSGVVEQTIHSHPAVAACAIYPLPSELGEDEVSRLRSCWSRAKD